MINPGIDLEAARTRLQRNGRVQVADYLQEGAAQRLRECLQREVPWTLALRDHGEARTIGHTTCAAMDDAFP